MTLIINADGELVLAPKTVNGNVVHQAQLLPKGESSVIAAGTACIEMVESAAPLVKVYSNEAPLFSNRKFSTDQNIKEIIEHKLKEAGFKVESQFVQVEEKAVISDLFAAANAVEYIERFGLSSKPTVYPPNQGMIESSRRLLAQGPLADEFIASTPVSVREKLLPYFESVETLAGVSQPRRAMKANFIITEGGELSLSPERIGELRVSHPQLVPRAAQGRLVAWGEAVVEIDSMGQLKIRDAVTDQSGHYFNDAMTADPNIPTLIKTVFKRNDWDDIEFERFRNSPTIILTPRN